MAQIKSKKMTLIALILSGFCMYRAFGVQAADAADRDADEDVEEVYDGRANANLTGTEPRDSGWGGRSPAGTAPRDGRFTRPEEAAARRHMVQGEDEYEQVEGVEHLNSQQAETKRAPASAIAVPVKPAGLNAAAEAGQSQSLAVSHQEAPQPKTPVLAPQARTEDRVAFGEESPIPVREGAFTATENNTKLARRSGDESAAEAFMAKERVRGVQEMSVIASDHGFFPSRLFVTQGVPVRVFLTTPSNGTSCFMIDSYGVKKGISPGHVEEVSFVPEQQGDYRFYCPVGGIEGRLTVRAPASAGS